MASINITTTAEEKDAVYEVIANNENIQLTLKAIANEAGLTISRTRYALEDLIESGHVIKQPTKAFNKHYVRYSYRIGD